MLSRKKIKGQVGEGLTWVVATIIILFILFIGIYVAGKAGLVKKIWDDEVRYVRTSDRVAEKSLNSYLLTMQDGESIYKVLKEEGDFNPKNGQFAVSIFERYEKDYPVKVWLGFDFEGIGSRKNDYFGVKPSGLRGGDINQRRVNFAQTNTQLNDEKYLALILMDE